MECTIILLDCHPNTQVSCVPEPTDSTIVPPCPLWSCFVEATLEYCRVVFDLFDAGSKAPPISVHVAGVPLERSILNNWNEQNLKQIAEKFTFISPHSVSPSPMRMQHALENSLKSLDLYEAEVSFNVRIVLILMAKGGEKQFSYRETEDQKQSDIRNMLRDIISHRDFWTKNNFSKLLKCHFDILRVFPSCESIPQDVPYTKLPISNIWTTFSATVYNVLPQRKCLTRSMLHLVQLHRQLNTLKLLERSDNTKTTFEIELLYPADNHLPHSNPIKSKRSRIFEPDHLKERQTVVKWVKAKLYGLDETVTRCTHLVTPIDISAPTRVLITSLVKGAIYALCDPTSSVTSTNIHYENTVQGKTPFSQILCFREVPNDFITSHNEDLSTYLSIFENYIVKPNITNINNINHGNFETKLIKIPGLSTIDILTTQSLDVETRWINNSIIKLQSSLPTPIYDIISQLKTLLIEKPPEDYLKIAKNILDRLFAMGKADSFRSISPKHANIYEFFVGRIKPDGTENKPSQSSNQSELMSSSISDPMTIVKNENKEMNIAWQQLDHYSSMSYREKQDFLEGNDAFPSSSQQIPQIPVRTRGQPYRGRGGFIGRRHHDDKHHVRNNSPTPYLQYKHTDEITLKKEQERYIQKLGDSRSFLFQYWMGKKKDKEYKELHRKDFDGRLPLKAQSNHEE
ncbi:5480_t:CDS:10 [Diversispora eburnea]|uniref:5480_t:CDS:1 n=1 Tax=Diversispora eburnea TaxID=1213867 RepID=A0A9N9BEI9_9GLOM|nr:5480_t:CDS:10 [Diversispora eburnea]